MVLSVKARKQKWCEKVNRERVQKARTRSNLVFLLCSWPIVKVCVLVSHS